MAIELALSALAFELLVGYPDRLYWAIGHPVTWIGALIARLDTGLNRADRSHGARRVAGVLALAVIVLAAIAAATAIVSLAHRLGIFVGFAALTLGACTRLAQRSLHRHVANVATALEDGDWKRGVERSRISLAVIWKGWMPPVSRVPPSRAWRRISPTAWSHRSCGWPLRACPAAPPTKRSIRQTA